jgi:hypothetical protein
VGTVVMKNWEPLLCITSVRVQLGTTRVNLRVGAGVSHGEETGLGVLDLEVLIRELITVDRLAAGTLERSVGVWSLGCRLTLPRVKSPPCNMNWGMMRWKELPL